MVQIAAAAPTEQRQATRRRILEAASRVFRRRGLQAAGMREIAAEAGMHAGNLYYYFRSKEELLAFCQEETLGQLLAAADAAQASGLPPEEALRQLIVDHLVCLNETNPGSLAHLEVEALSGPWRERIQRRRDRYERLLRELVRAGVHDGAFRRVDAKAATLVLLGALNWTVKWFRPDGPASAREMGERFADLLLGGLAATGREAR
jgi:AcrR family transcriptional regulator